jgi:hypothetical protein
MTSGDEPVCFRCVNFDGVPEWSCRAFPTRIPDDIVENTVDHTKPHAGDHGIRFEQVPDQYFVTIGATRTVFRITKKGVYERYVPILDRWDFDGALVRFFNGSSTDFDPIYRWEAMKEIAKMQEEIKAMSPTALRWKQTRYRTKT